MNKWLESIQNLVNPNTYQKYESINRNHIAGSIGSILVRLVSSYTIKNFTNQMLESKLSVKTVNDILIVLKLAFSYASEEYEIFIPKDRYLKEKKRNKGIDC